MLNKVLTSLGDKSTLIGNNWYWSSSVDTYFDNAWQLEFSDGALGSTGKSNTLNSYDVLVIRSFK